MSHFQRMYPNFFDHYLYMGIINFIDKQYSSNNYRCAKTETSFLMFSSLNYYYNVKFSNKITNNVWLGNYADSSNETFIRENNIRVVVNCSKDLPFYFNEKEVPFRYRIPVDDDRQDNSMYIMYQYLPKIVDIIRYHVNRGENVYVHCHAGMQRSACVVAGYLMAKYGLTPEDAIKFIKSKRPIAFTPYVNFQKSIDNYYNSLTIKN